MVKFRRRSTENSFWSSLGIEFQSLLPQVYFHSTLGLSSLKSLAREMVFVSCCMFINTRTGSLLEELGRKCWTFSCVQDTNLVSARSISVKLRHQMNCTSRISVQGNCCFSNSIQLFNLFGMQVYTYTTQKWDDYFPSSGHFVHK